jgi:hypothetical protein
MFKESINEVVGVLGSTSLVGSFVLGQLKNSEHSILALTRQCVTTQNSDIEWIRLKNNDSKSLYSPVDDNFARLIPLWISAAPIWVLPEYFELMLHHGVRRLVAISSTSIITKINSSDPREKIISEKITKAEQRVKNWANKNRIEIVILRPTLINGCGRDKNISEIARFISRWGFFPVFGQALGLRQPIHARDVASACCTVLISSIAKSSLYTISGGEILTYREMVERVFHALKKKPRLITIPLIFFKVAIGLLRMIPRYRKWSFAMAERMNSDLVFDHNEAARDFNFSPSNFKLTESDVFLSNH